jgi:hypothetical protein
MSPEVPSLPLLPYLLNEQESAVYEALRKHYGDQAPLHEWYLGALEALHLKNNDFIAQAAHSIREITDQLPRHAGISPFRSPISNGNDLRDKFTRLKQNTYSEGWRNKTITPALAAFLDDLSKFYQICDAPPRTSRFRLALSTKDPGSNELPEFFRIARTKAFQALGKYFEKAAHHNHVPSEADFRLKLQEFEAILINYLTPVTSQQQREILEIISCSPDATTISALRELIVHNSANYALIIDKLENPEWLPVLQDFQFFATPPSEEKSESGSFFRSWPSLQLLSRLAEQAPVEVLHILDQVPDTPNPLINDHILRCLSRITTSENSEAQLKIAKRCSNRVTKSGHLWLEELLKNWIQRGNDLPALELMRGFLHTLVRMNKPGARDEIGWSTRSLDKSCIAPISSRRPIELCDLLFHLLENIRGGYEKNNRPENPTYFLTKHSPPNDPPTYWIPDFFSPRSYDHQIESVLACRLYQIGKHLFSLNNELEISHFDTLLRSSPWHLFQRIRWQVYADVPAQSLGLARRDLLDLVRLKELFRSLQNFELAAMLESHSIANGHTFLSPEEVDQYVEASCDCSDHEGEDLQEAHNNILILERLHPIRSLLNGAPLELYQRLAQDRPPLGLEDYKPFRTRGGTVRQVAPAQANIMSSMSDSELWKFLNTWQPATRPFSSDDWLTEESPRALGKKFAQLMDEQPERFRPESKWWSNLKRPECVSQPLERAAQRIAKKTDTPQGKLVTPPTENDWQNWFGLAQWIAESAPATIPESGEEGRPNWPWNWPCILAISFLKTASNEPQFEPPAELKVKVGLLLTKFAEMPDPHLVETTRHWLVDWLTTASNSLRGTAVEGLLDLAQQQKSNPKSNTPEPWMFEALERILRVPDQSPAIFGLMGARVNTLLYLFAEELNACDGSTLLLPPDSIEARAAFVTAHYRYSSAFPQLLSIIPELPRVALDVLEQFEAESKPPTERGEGFAHRLGVHLAYYFWNASYRNDDEGWAALDRFFEVAKLSSRSRTLFEIGDLFTPVPFNNDQKALFDRAMAIWERRVGQILAANDRSEFHDELGAFAEWFGADCFPFEWRYHHFTQVLQVLPETPKMFRFMEILRKVTLEQGHLTEGLQILRQVVERAHFPEFGWNYQVDELKVILKVGIHAPDPETRVVAEEVQELLLRHRCFEYLDL